MWSCNSATTIDIWGRDLPKCFCPWKAILDIPVPLASLIWHLRQCEESTGDCQANLHLNDAGMDHQMNATSLDFSLRLNLLALRKITWYRVSAGHCSGKFPTQSRKIALAYAFSSTPACALHWNWTTWQNEKPSTQFVKGEKKQTSSDGSSAAADLMLITWPFWTGRDRKHMLKLEDLTCPTETAAHSHSLKHHLPSQTAARLPRPGWLSRKNFGSKHGIKQTPTPMHRVEIEKPKHHVQTLEAEYDTNFQFYILNHKHLPGPRLEPHRALTVQTSKPGRNPMCLKTYIYHLYHHYCPFAILKHVYTICIYLRYLSRFFVPIYLFANLHLPNYLSIPLDLQGKETKTGCQIWFQHGLKDGTTKSQHSLQMDQQKPETDPKFNLNGTMLPLGLKF